MAVANGVKVYFFDNSVQQTMRARNEKMGEEFRLNAPQPEVGVVVLIGGAHLEGKVEETLQNKCGIGPDRLIDFSRL